MIDQLEFQELESQPTGNYLQLPLAECTIESTGVLLPLMFDVRCCQYHGKAWVVIFVTNRLLQIFQFYFNSQSKNWTDDKCEYDSLTGSRNLPLLYENSFSMFSMLEIVKLNNPKTRHSTLFQLLPANENKKWICKYSYYVRFVPTHVQSSNFDSYFRKLCTISFRLPRLV